MQSFFYSTEKPISFINVDTGIPHKEYCSQSYNDDSLWTKAEREKYIHTVNEWLSYKYVDSHILRQKDKQYDYEYNNMYDTMVDKDSYEDTEYNDDNCSFLAFNNNDDDEYNDDVDDNFCDYIAEDIGENEVPITNQYVCKKIFDEIYECITKNGFEIYNYNQFKEDFIHYIYILSDNRKPK